MDEIQNAGSSGFEDRIRGLLEEGATTRSVSATAVIRGARRRRVRHRATAAGSSLAVLGVTAGAIAFAGPGSGSSRDGARLSAAGSSGATTTCSAAVTGTVPGTTSATVDGLSFQTISGTTAGYSWGVQIHVFPDKQSHLAWENTLPAGSIPQAAKDAEHAGAVAQFRTLGKDGYTEEGGSGADDEQYFTIQQGAGLGTGVPDDSVPGMPANLTAKFPAYVTSGWMASDVDHLCAQYAGHADFVPVYRIQGGKFYAFGYKDSDRPQAVIGYGSAGQVVGKAVATKGDPYSLMPVRAGQLG